MIDIHPQAERPDFQGAPGAGRAAEPAADQGALVIHRTSRSRRRSRRRATVVYAVISIVFVAMVGVLGVEGYHASRRVRGGFTTHRITDPAAPGYEVAVLPTPVHLAALVDDSGKLVDFYVFIGGTGTRGNAVLWIVGDLAVDVEGQPLQSLYAQYSTGGMTAARAQIEKLLGLGVTDTVTLGPDQIQTMFERVGTLTIKNPDALFAGQGAQRKEVYPSGSIKLKPADVSAYLRFKDDGEVATNRATRASLVMDAYFPALAKVADATGPAVATDKGADLVATAATMASGDVGFEILPVSDKPYGVGRYFTPDRDRIATEVTKLVPFPVSAFPGQRPRVRILSSTTDRAAPQGAAPVAVAAGAEILVIGNSKVADVASTVVEYHDPSQEAAAGRIAKAFGVTAVASTDQTESYDVTVTLGTGYHG